MIDGSGPLVTMKHKECKARAEIRDFVEHHRQSYPDAAFDIYEAN